MLFFCHYRLLLLRVRCLCEPEALAALVDREQQLLTEHLVRRVLWQVDLVEACRSSMLSVSSKVQADGLLTSVGLRKTVGVAVRLVDREALRALNTL